MLTFFFSFAVKIYLIHHVKFVSMPVYRNSCVPCYIWDRTRTCWNKPSWPGDLIKFDKNSFNRMFNQRVHGLYCHKVSKTLAMPLDPFKQVSFHCTIAVNLCFGSSSFPQSVFLVWEVHIDESLLVSNCQMHDYCLKYIFSLLVTTWILSRPKWLYRDVVQVHWKACRN